MDFGYRACNRKPHTHTAFLGREKRLKYFLRNVRLNPWPSIRDRKLRRVVMQEMCLDGDSAVLPARCCKDVDGISDQVKNNLLQFHSVALTIKEEGASAVFRITS